jgi:hypothetical protein
MSDPTSSTDAEKKPAGKKRAPPAAAAGDVTPPRAVAGVPMGDGTVGNPIVVSSIDRAEVQVRRGFRAYIRGGRDLSSTTVPAAAVPAYFAAPPAAAAPPVLAAPPAAAVPPPGAAVPGNFMTLFNHHGFFLGGVTAGFKTRREAGLALEDTTLISVDDYQRLVKVETQQVNTNIASEAPPSVVADDIASRIFPDPRTTSRANPIHFLREFATKFYMTPVPWDASLKMGDLLVYAFVMLNSLRDGLDERLKFVVPKTKKYGKDTRFGVTYSHIVETLAPLLSSAMVHGPGNVHVCDFAFKSYNKKRERNPDFLFLVLPIFKMVKAFFPGKTKEWYTALSRTGKTVIKAQKEKIVDHGVYSMGLLEQFSIPGGTARVPHDTLLKGMLFEYALLLAFVNPVFCGDEAILQKVLAKRTRTPDDHYYILPVEKDLYRDPAALLVYYSGDGIFYYNARVLQRE